MCGINGYNPYSPYGYGAQPQQLPAAQPMQQPASQAYPQTPANGPVVLYAPTAKDFQGIAVQPGRQALIIAQNEPYMAHKVADGMGMVQTTLYRIEQVTETDINAPAQEYATKGELAQLQQIVQQIVDSIAPKKTAKKEAASE